MAKALKTAAIVVGGAALIATGIGAAATLGAFGTVLAGSATAGFLATAATVATVAGFAAAALAVGSTVLAGKPKGSLGGNQTAFKIDKDAGLPVGLGRSVSGGNVGHRSGGYGPKNAYESWVIVDSIGPIDGYESTLIDNTDTSFAGGAASGFYSGYMWQDEQVGEVPEASALTGPFGPFPGWDASSKLSGLAASLWTLKWDTNGKKFPAGVPKRRRVLRGVKSYDPRQDSSYPGGSGPCRSYDRASWVYTENPALNALTWAIGHMMAGVKVAGGGLPITGILLQPFVEWANVCDANGWKVGGQVYATADNTWDVLRMICQAGAAEPVAIGGMLSVDFSAPRVSIGLITSNDIAGDIDVPSTAARRNRINGVVPRIRSEAHDWEVIPLEPVIVDDYVTFDGGKRTREIEFPLVQQADQGAELATYAILDARELDPIVLPSKVYMIGYLPGDCLTADIPEANLLSRQVVVRNRELDMGSAVVTFSCRSETPGKHDFALGRTGVAPPTPDLEIPDLTNIPAPAEAAWTVTGTTLTDNGVSVPAIVITGAVDNPYASNVVFEYRPSGATTWISAGITSPDVIKREITSVTPGTTYDVAISYIVRGVLGSRRVYTVTTGAFSGIGDTTGPVSPIQYRQVIVGTSDTILLRLDLGQTANVSASLAFGPIASGTKNATVAIEYREAGGTWVAGASGTDGGGIGDVLVASASDTVTNSIGNGILYEFRANGSLGGSGTGTPRPELSTLAVY